MLPAAGSSGGLFVYSPGGRMYVVSARRLDAAAKRRRESEGRGPSGGFGRQPNVSNSFGQKAVSEQDAKHPTIETGADSAKLDFSRKIV